MMISAILSRDFSSNSYVIGNCIIDPGTGTKDYGIAPEDVKLVLLTHNHYDHWTNCALFRNARVLVHEADLEGLRLGRNTYGKGKVPNAEALPAKIKAGSVTFEVIHTPGHTPGSVCFFDRKEKTLISGDTLFADGVGRTDLAGGDTAKLRKSIEMLSKLDFEHLLPGHGAPGNKGSAYGALEFIKQM